MFLFAKKNRFQIGKSSAVNQVTKKLDKADTIFVETSSSIERRFAPKGYSCNIYNKRKDIRKIEIKLRSVSTSKETTTPAAVAN